MEEINSGKYRMNLINNGYENHVLNLHSFDELFSLEKRAKEAWEAKQEDKMRNRLIGEDIPEDEVEVYDYGSKFFAISEKNELLEKSS